MKDKDGKQKLGDVFFFALQKDDGKLCSELIYRNTEEELEFYRKELRDTATESELFEIQQTFFRKVGEELPFGKHLHLNLVECVQKAAFETLGKFRLIDEKEFGYEFRYYVPNRCGDGEFEMLKELANAKYSRNFEEARQKQIKIENQLRKMSARMVTVRLREKTDAPAWAGEVFNTENYAGIRKLANWSDYTFERGINHR